MFDGKEAVPVLPTKQVASHWIWTTGRVSWHFVKHLCCDPDTREIGAGGGGSLSLDAAGTVL